MGKVSSGFTRLRSRRRASLLCYDSEVVLDSHGGSASLSRSFEDLSLSKCMLRNPSRRKKSKLMKKQKVNHFVENAGTESRRSTSRCLSLYFSGGGCQIGAGGELDSSTRRRVSNASEVEKVELECFSYNLPGKLRKKNSCKMKEVDESSSPRGSAAGGFLLPNDLLEMILIRLPFASLSAARCVCSAWRNLMGTSQFMKMRLEGPYRNPWLFLFGIRSTRGQFGEEIHALDTALGQWRRVDAPILKNRISFSVVGVGSDIYIVGGCFVSADHCKSSEDISLRVEKEVFVFNPMAGSWGNVSQMNSARSGPVLGAFEVGTNCCLFHKRFDHEDHQDRIRPRARSGRALEVFEDPHKLSLRLRQSDTRSEPMGSREIETHTSISNENQGDCRIKFALIAVGGNGPCNKPLESAEVYNIESDRWVEVARLPREFGPVCSSVVCGRKFYVLSTDNLASFDLDRGFWLSIQTLRPPPCLHEYCPKLISCKNRLFMVSVSWSDEGLMPDGRAAAMRKMWEIDLRPNMNNTWTKVSVHPDAPTDRHAVFVADDCSIYGFETFRAFGRVLDSTTVCPLSDSYEPQWLRASRQHAVQDADLSSCARKSAAILHL